MADQKYDGYAKADLTKKLVDGEIGGVTFNNLTPGSDYDFVTAYAGQDPTKFGTDLGKVTTPQPATIAVTGMDVQPDKASIDIGKTQQLTLTVQPDNATNKAATYKSSDVTIATVDDKGLVTGVKAGTATITASSVDGNKQATSAITVNAPASSSATPASSAAAPASSAAK
uniref:Ig-like domain-containing protein n=1 Tax=Lentilactobacillus hilgardii TaxID=1588 RepID=UPI00403F5632